jgi:hypothetical protein
MIIVKVVIAVVAGIVVLRIGLWGLRLVSTPVPPPPPSGELRRVNVRFRCPICGMEMKVTLAAEESPEPPRHCMTEMEVVAAPYD